MGYLTIYELHTPSSYVDFHKENIEKMSEEEDAFDCQTYWYEHEKHLREYSKKFPDTVFSLYGQGEDTEGIWWKHFKDGKMQKCPAIITFDEYDEAKLQ